MDNKRIVINWSAAMGTILIIAAITAATIWKLRYYRKKSVNDILASMQQPKKGILTRDLYPNRLNIDKEGSELNSSEIERSQL